MLVIPEVKHFKIYTNESSQYHVNGDAFNRLEDLVNHIGKDGIDEYTITVPVSTDQVIQSAEFSHHNKTQKIFLLQDFKYF